MGESKIVTSPDELRAAIRRASMRVPSHMVAEEVARELQTGRDPQDVRPTDEDRANAERVVRRRRMKGR